MTLIECQYLMRLQYFCDEKRLRLQVRAWYE